MKKVFVTGAVSLALLFSLSGCSAGTKVSHPTSSSTAPAPSATKVALSTVEGIPVDESSLVSTDKSDPNKTILTFTGNSQSVVSLKQGFLDSGFTWTDIAGDGMNVLSSGKNLEIVISTMTNNTYTITILKS